MYLEDDRARTPGRNRATVMHHQQCVEARPEFAGADVMHVYSQAKTNPSTFFSHASFHVPRAPSWSTAEQANMIDDGMPVRGLPDPAILSSFYLSVMIIRIDALAIYRRP